MEEDSVLSPEVIEYIQRNFDEDTYWNKQERIARKVMVELVKAGRSEFLLLRDDEVSKWWGSIVGGIQSKIAKHKERVRLYEIKLQAYNKLSAAERKMLGIRKPIKPKGY
jgi:hypothetical protein